MRDERSVRDRDPSRPGSAALAVGQAGDLADAVGPLLEGSTDALRPVRTAGLAQARVPEGRDLSGRAS